MGARPVKVRILIGFNGYEAGQVFDNWPSGMCEGLIAMGAIEEVKDESAATAPKPEVVAAGKRRGGRDA